MSDFYADASYYRRWKLDKNNLVHMVPGVLSSEAIKEEFEGNYWFALYNNDVFESELTAIMDKYVVLWEGKPIMDYVEGKKAQRSEDGE